VRLTAGDPECVLAMILEYRPFARAGPTIIEDATFDGRDPPRDMASRSDGRRHPHVSVTLDRRMRWARQQAGFVSLKHKCSWPLSGALVRRKWEWDCKCTGVGQHAAGYGERLVYQQLAEHG